MIISIDIIDFSIQWTDEGPDLTEVIAKLYFVYYK